MSLGNRATVRFLATGLVLATVAAALTLRIQIPFEGILRPFSDAAGPDYGLGVVGPFSPLTDAFVSGAVGDLVPDVGPAPPTVRRDGTPTTEPPRLIVTHTPSNDAVASARPIPSIPYTAKTDSASATRSAEDPSDCAGVGDTNWYRYVPERDIGLVADTFGTDHVTILGVFEELEGTLRPIENGCSGPDRDGDSFVMFPAREGIPYLFQISAPAGGGPQVFNLAPSGEPRQISPDHRTHPSVMGDDLYGVHPPANWKPSISADARVVAWLTTDAAAIDDVEDFPSAPCASNLPSASFGSAYSWAGWSPIDPLDRPYSPDPCTQLVVYDRARSRRQLASISSSGHPANAHVWGHSLSGDGRWVAFETYATNLQDGLEDTNGLSDVFVHDLTTGLTELVTVSASGAPLERDVGDVIGNGSAHYPSISYDGRFVAFQSAASELARAGHIDVFIRDRLRGTTTRIDLGPDDDRDHVWPCASSNGRFVVFSSVTEGAYPDRVLADGSVATAHLYDAKTRRVEEIPGSGSRQWSGGKNCVSDSGRYVVSTIDGEVRLWDRVRGQTIEIAPREDQQQDPQSQIEAIVLKDALAHSITPDGRFIALTAFGGRTAGDSNRPVDVNDAYVFDLRRGTLMRVSLTIEGDPIEADAVTCAISGDGRFVVYDTLRGGALGIAPSFVGVAFDAASVFLLKRGSFS